MVFVRAVRSALSCDYENAATAVTGRRALAVVEFGAEEGPAQLRDGVPVVRIRAAATESAGFREVWTTDGDARTGHTDGLVYAHDDDILFCAGHIRHGDRYAAHTRERYAAAFGLADALGYPTLVRMWNYVGDINAANADGLEIYRDFCLGRAEAFAAHGKAMPAATGVGTHGSGVVFYFLSCRSGGVTHIENPRQIPAYRYPRRYGPKAPTFARATHLLPDGGSDTLFVSGTAAILGHETVCTGDVVRQCEVALANIRELVGEQNLGRYGIAKPYGLAAIRRAKVYVRHREHLEVVRRACAAALPPEAEIAYLVVDICRRDLLVEIEAVA
ncbi:hypothetical protein GZH49_30640 [Nocardia terpenica]